MFREIGILIGAFVCILFFVPIMHQSNGNPIGVLALVLFILLMFYSGFHIKKLYSKTPIGALVFSMILLLTVYISFIYFWWLSRPIPIDYYPSV
jgi:uncharacterized membrane protein